MTTRSFVVIGLLLVGLFATVAANRNSGEQSAPNTARSTAQPPNAARPLPVQTMTLAKVDHYETKSVYTGTIVAGQSSELGFERLGKLVSISVDEGADVEVGQEVARLDMRQLRTKQSELLAQLATATAQMDMLVEGPRKQSIAAARARVSSLKSQLNLQRENLLRRKQLYQRRAVSRENYDQSLFGFKSATANVEAAQKVLEELLEGSRSEELKAQQAVIRQFEAALDSLDVQLNDSVLKAPFRGTLAKRYVDEGTVLAPGAAVVRLVALSREAHIGLPIAVARELDRGQSLVIGTANADWDANVRCVLPELNPRTRTQTAILDWKDKSEATSQNRHQNRPAVGDVVRLSVPRREFVTGFLVPSTALDRGQRGLWAVMAVVQTDEKAVVSRRDVEVLFSDSKSSFVRGAVVEGDKIVASGLHRLVNGQVVEVIEKQVTITVPQDSESDR